MPTITNPKNDRRTLTHRGSEVGSSNVTRSQNTVDSWTPILEWTGPEEYDQIDYAGGIHPTKAELRAQESITGSTGDDTVVSLSTNIVPIGGETTIADQPFPVVRAVNTTSGNELDISSVDYAANEVTLATDPADGETVKLWPVIADGLIQYRGVDQFNHTVGSLDQWGTPLHVFANVDQMQSDSKIHLVGRGSFGPNEVLAVYVNSPDQVVWDDADYPDSYVSTFQQKVDVSV